MKIKIGFTFIVFFFIYCIIIGKSFYIQVLNRDKLISYSQRQSYRKKTLTSPRGQIVDRNDNPLTLNIKTYDLFKLANEDKIADPGLKLLSKTVPGVSYAKLKSQIKVKNKFHWIKRKVVLTREQFLTLKGIKNLEIRDNDSRVYPNREILSQVLGYIGVDGKGLDGVEYFYNDQLKGTKESKELIKDAKGRSITINSKPTTTPIDSTLKLSIDIKLQEFAETALKETVLYNEALKGGIGVLNPHTGEILAMANYPHYDPNSFSNYNPSQRRLGFVTDFFEPGSIIKPFTVAAGLNEKVISANSVIQMPDNFLQIGKHRVKESFDKKYGKMTITEILKYSSNVGVSKIGFKVGYKKLVSYFDKFGFGKKTGIEYPSEASGLLNKKDSSMIRLSNLSFGQGIATTGIQMLSAWGALANNGVLVKPTLNKVIDPKTVSGSQIIPKEVADQVNKMLVEVVNSGTGMNSKIDGYNIAGKTSTAQKVVNGSYNGFIAGFIGFPTNTPTRYVIFSYIDSPKKYSHFGSQVAAPLFKKVMAYVLKDEVINTKISWSQIKNKNLTKSLNVEATKEINKEKIERNIASGLPNFVGLDRISAQNLAQKNNINLKSVGYGIVYKQSPEPGKTIDPKEMITLYLMPPTYE